MSEPKAFASLSSGLLARKGGAKPAMRPQGLAPFGASVEDLGWNDMGTPETPPAPEAAARNLAEARSPATIAVLAPVGVEEREQYEPAPPVVELQQTAIAASFAKPVLAEVGTQAGPPQKTESKVVSPAIAHARAVEPGLRTKTAFTLRLEADRHLKLRLACAVTGRSAQQLVTEALDQLLRSRPEIADLADRVPGNARTPK